MKNWNNEQLVLDLIHGGWLPYSTEPLEVEVILDIIYHYTMWFLNFMLSFGSLAWIEVWQEYPVLEAILGGHWRDLTSYLVGGIIFDIMDLIYLWFLTCVPIFSCSSMNILSLKTFFEDLNGSILETWKMESFVTSWIAFICDSWLV